MSRISAGNGVASFALSRVAPARADSVPCFDWLLDMQIRESGLYAAMHGSALSDLIDDLRSLGCQPSVVVLEPHALD